MPGQTKDKHSEGQ